jgi:PadR family transcriptional regulator PadR
MTNQHTIAWQLRALNAVRRFFGRPERQYLTDHEWRQYMQSIAPQRPLARFENLTLLAVCVLGPDAYGMPIRRKLAEYLDREVLIGAAYLTLEQLKLWGFLDTWVGEATPERSNRPKRYFKLTNMGWAHLRGTYPELTISAQKVAQTTPNAPK